MVGEKDGLIIFYYLTRIPPGYNLDMPRQDQIDNNSIGWTLSSI